MKYFEKIANEPIPRVDKNHLTSWAKKNIYKEEMDDLQLTEAVMAYEKEHNTAIPDSKVWKSLKKKRK